MNFITFRKHMSVQIYGPETFQATYSLTPLCMQSFVDISGGSIYEYSTEIFNRESQIHFFQFQHML